MPKSYAVITFSNDEKLIVHEGDMFIPINLVDYKNEQYTSQREPYKVWKHTHVGFIPSLTELISSSQFFSTLENENIVYSSSAVVKITNI
ncbi:hypothetical protein [Bacillus wiedmannii]|uniref:hypothetical protein n=1 Tax=Bacillus wiedmannii TaxID=1890302 RepID=UPI000BEF65D2|nr:hypothetical protein [Bacillus wiedmannii]MCU5330657.1 hypothetical protein [Bacillus wiedmannii]PEL82383.1 hypothetical protein CN626_30700 [Bacillus wiedmannii]